MTAFQLTANPFWLLETSPRARREDIIEAFEEAVSAGKTPEQELLRAQQTILTPKTRLDAELAWLPELSPTRAKELAATLSSNPSSPAVKPLLEAVDGLAKANLAADLCSRFPGQTEFAKALAESYRTFDTEVIESTINAARGVAGFATVNREMLDTSLAAIEAIHAKAAVRCLSGAPQPGDALRQLLEGAGDGKPRELLDAVAREYGGWAEIPLREIGDQIRRDITGLRDRPDEQESVTSIKRALTRWSGVIGPLQALERDKGLDEPRSKAIYDELRVLCLWLVNEQNLIVPALEISRGLLAAFSALPTVSNQVADDIDTLQRMAADAQTAERMAPLLSAAQEVRSNLAKLDSGLTGTEFGPKAKGLAKVLFDAFVLAVDASADSENASVPWTIVRSLAIELNNNAEAEEAALEMVVGLLAFRGGPSDPEIRAKLEEDRRTIRSNTLWNTIKWHLQRNEMNKALPILESLIAETPPKTEQWQNLFSCRQDVVAAMGKARNKKIKGWLTIGGIAIFVLWVSLANDKPAPVRHAAYSPPAGTYTAPPATTYQAPQPSPQYPADNGAEAAPVFGAVDPSLTKPQLRWCKFQGARLDRAKLMITNNAEVANFNAAVNDYNGRCSQFHYRKTDMDAIEWELIVKNAAIDSEARMLLSGKKP